MTKHYEKGVPALSASSYPSVAVLMSTYNGEKYLREQVDSILNQKGVNVHLFIRDDGSKDATLDIVREYMDANPGKISLTTGENLGPGRSFMELVYQSPDTYDYYAFSDQDDVWLDDKLIAGINALKASGKELYVGNQMCVDEYLNEIGVNHRRPPDLHPCGILEHNVASGCTMVFSNRMRRLLCDEAHRPDGNLVRFRYHDTWTVMTASVLNMLVYDSGYHILYRQHGRNAVGSATYDGIWKNTVSSLRRKADKALNPSKRNLRSKLAREIVRVYPEETGNFPFLQLCAQTNKPKNKIKLIRSYKEYREHGTQSFLGFCLYVCLNLI